MINEVTPLKRRKINPEASNICLRTQDTTERASTREDSHAISVSLFRANARKRFIEDAMSDDLL